MDHEEILTPVAMYRDRFKEEHRKNTAEAFEALAKRSGVDEAANAELVRKIRKLEKEVASLDARLTCWKVARGLAIAIAVGGGLLALLWLVPLLGGNDFGVSAWAALGGMAALILSLVLIFTLLNDKVKTFSALVDARRAELKTRMDEAWNMMAPLNRLYRWDTVASIIMKTLPIIAIDRFVSAERLRQLAEQFRWIDMTANDRSVLACQSGSLNGNPWVIAEELHQTWGSKTYTGSLVITWQEQEYYTDSNGRRHSRWVTRTQTLVASVTKPIPVYDQYKRLIYGNEAAPMLSFSRKPNPLSGADDGFLGRLKLKSAISALEKKSRDLNNSFTIMDNREFDACFDAVDRDNEQQFRLLFTPLAQQEMLVLMRDREQGYGDDFTFYKRGMINTLLSEHLDQLDITGSPRNFMNYDLADARKNFNDYSNNFFRIFYFAFAPFLCIPLYQQHRNFKDIYKGIIEDGEAGFFEHEALVNDIGGAKFSHPSAVTRSILKTEVAARVGSDDVLTVTAYAFRGESRVDHVPTYGGDGKWHQVPVYWTEYLPVSHSSRVTVCTAGTGDHLEFAEKFNLQQWKERLAKLGARDLQPLFRRGLAAFVQDR